MHAADVLCEQIFAIEVVGLVSICAQIAAPETQAHVLSRDVSLPFILRSKGA